MPHEKAISKKGKTIKKDPLAEFEKEMRKAVRKLKKYGW